jgi:hypothetical protein
MSVWLQDWILHFLSSASLGSLVFFLMWTICWRAYSWASGQDQETGRVETAGQLILVVSLLSLLLGVWLAHVWLDYVLKPGW